jgi:hypothetical protein
VLGDIDSKFSRINMPQIKTPRLNKARCFL